MVHQLEVVKDGHHAELEAVEEILAEALFVGVELRHDEVVGVDPLQLLPGRALALMESLDSFDFSQYQNIIQNLITSQLSTQNYWNFSEI